MPSAPIGRSRLVWAGVCALGVIVLAILSVASPASARKVRATCGVERWTVKTLQDRPRLLPVKRTTIAYLVRRPVPSYLPNTRLPFERHVFRVAAAACDSSHLTQVEHGQRMRCGKLSHSVRRVPWEVLR
jgi:hypothetical protein